MELTGRPGVELARRPLHFFLLADCSGSMASAGKMAALNTAVREVLPHLADTSARNPHAQVLVRAIGFSTGASWHVAEPTDPEELLWEDLHAGGYTDLGAALRLLRSVLTVPPMEERALAPAIVVASDGMPTDDFEDALGELLEEPWGERSIRLAIAIGADADYATLARLTGPDGPEPLTAANPEQLVMALRWATTQVSRAASTLLPVQAPPVALTSGFVPDSPEEAVW